MNDAKEVLFIPYAAVTISFDYYEKVVAEAFARFGYTLKSIHHEADPVAAIEKATVIVTGGGNTFALVSRLYENKVLEPIKKKVSGGTPYIGWSAGANIACPTMMTTNDMPIVQPLSFNTLGLVPFQLNPHYTEYQQPGHGGETRRQRLEEFLVLNPHCKVIGLPEGMLLHRDGNMLTLEGTGMARVFGANGMALEFTAGSDLSSFL